MKINWQSTSVKLYFLLGLVALLLVGFLISFSKHYVNYYLSLYKYRQNLVERLTTKDIKKPEYNPGDIYTGNPNANIVIFEYSDFSCTACREVQKTLIDLLSFYGVNNVFIVFKDTPLTTDPENLLAHQAAHCAFEQKKFDAYKLALFDNQGEFQKEQLIEYAKETKLEMKKFEECLSSEKYRSTVIASLNDALRLGINATPTLFINNQEVESGFTINNLRSIVEKTK